MEKLIYEKINFEDIDIELINEEKKIDKRIGKPNYDIDKKGIHVATRLWNTCGYASFESVKYIISYTIFKKGRREFKDTLKHIEEAIEYRDYGIHDNYKNN